MALPTAAALATLIVSDLSIPARGQAAAVAQWTLICQRILTAIESGVVTVNLADGTGIAPGVNPGGSNIGLSGTVTGSMT
jgi:hypothetical protein